MREIVHRLHRHDYGFVAIANERLVGCGPLLGKSSSKPLGVHNPSIQIGNENGPIMITTSRRTRVFGISFSAGYFVVARRHDLRKPQVVHVMRQNCTEGGKTEAGAFIRDEIYALVTSL